MPPNIIRSDIQFACDSTEERTVDVESTNPETESKESNAAPIKKSSLFDFETELKWFNIFFIALLHFSTVVSILTFDYLRDWRTSLWIVLMYIPPGFGVTGGAHRLWTHRAYAAKWPLRVILLLCYCTAGQNTLYDWVRDHRIHHKYSETNADPHNSKRGFFFAHVGWLMMKKHPEVIVQGRQVNMNDILDDPVYKYSAPYFKLLKFLCCFVLPSMIPVFCWNETWARALVSQCLIRYTTTLNFTWSVNSAAHIWGSKPYNKHIDPVENKIVSFFAMGEGWHNYHHTFPWDYKAAELGDNYLLNLTTLFINLFAKIGWAYDLKEPSQELVKAVAMKKGDGHHPLWGEINESSKVD